MDAASAPRDLNQTLASSRVVLCVGCGGVGKTTTCAALGLAAAMRGKRVLCLTIDPAKRLAQSLGLESFDTEAQVIDADVFTRAGLEVPGSLTVMMLDTKTTFDDLVRSLADSDEQRDRILDNVLYRYISTTLAGTQEYMAMEKLYAVKDDDRYDIVFLDTPPTSHALDFLDAPERLVGAIDSPAVRWFIRAFSDSGRFSLNLLQRGAATILKGVGKITGGGFLEQVAVFLTEFNALFGSWRERAEVVSSALREEGVSYVLVTTPEPTSIREVLFFGERLRAQDMRPDAYVVNRVHQPPEVDATEAEVADAMVAEKLLLDDQAARRVLEAVRHETRLASLNRLNLFALEEAFTDDGGPVPAVAYIPDSFHDIHDVSRLAWVAEQIAPADLAR
ncbi:MAG: ArsA-related P-loop ATPase [Myxococcota bacterium]